MSLEIGFASQTPSLPTGGSVGGLGETFAPDLSTGSGTFSVPLDLPNGPNDVGPRLMLRYDTGSPNGPFGLGWTLALPRILRSTSRGLPRYDDSDQLVLEGSGPLVRTADGWEPEVSTGDWRIEQQGDGWLVTDRAGTRYRLGTGAGSRIEAGGAPWAWLVEQIEDNLGSTVDFTWRAAGAQRYLESVAYGVYRIDLAYEPRPDRLRWARGGFLLQTDERCARIELHLTGELPSLMRRWDIAYTQGEPNGASLLTGITLTGADRDGGELTAPGLTLSYGEPGRARLVAIPAQDDRAAPPLMDGGGRVELVDWDGDGVADVVEFGNGGETRIWPNRGGSWGRPVSAEPVPQLAGATARAGLIDFDGDGLADAVRIDQPMAGYQPRTGEGFGRPVSWTRAPAVTLASNACRLADLDGDGAADLMWSAGDSLLLAHRRDPGGWDERPLVVSATPGGPPTDLTDPHVHCADMTGDGTPDLVRVDGRGTTYWPYLGQGSFGEPVTMPGAPVLGFDSDPARVFVVDLDGDGCADVLAFDDRAGVLRWWPNCMGERFGEPRTVAHLPTGAMRELRVADVLGTGRPALCWSVPRASGRAAWFALDLLGGQTPGLLTGIDNGVGLATAITYTTSAAERERDRSAGHEWPQTLSLVLPLVASTTVSDRAGGRSDTTTYRYHDGRYDGRRREFAGFGRVEQVDAGDEHVAPLTTVRWFHTGLDDDGQEPPTEAERTRRRALRGRMLRQDRADETGAVLDRLEQAWEAVDGEVAGVVRPRLRSTTTSRIEGGAEPVSWIVTETLAWDPDGNATEQVEQSHIAGSPAATATLRTHTQYARDPDGRYRQRVCRVRQDDGAGTSLADSITFYDDLPLGAVGAQGLVTSRIALALTDETAEQVYGAQPPDLRLAGYVRRAEAPGWWIELGSYHREQDAGGLRGAVTGLRGATSTITFDPTGCYPVAVTDAMGNTAAAEFDPRVYQPTSFTAPGGALSTAHFDALARLTAVIEPGDTQAEPTVAYAYRSNVVPTEVAVQRRGTPGAPPLEQRQFLDGAGNLLERRARDDAGEVSEVVTAYGARGLPVGHWLPRRAAGDEYAPPDPGDPHAELSYDALGRPVRTVRPDGARHSVRYLPGMVEEADEEDLREQAPAAHAGSITRRYLDAAGRAVRVEQQLGGRTLTTSYRYDLRGNVTEHVDAAGRATRFVHDLMGRPLRVERPEAVHVNIVDPAGNPVETRSGEHRVLRSFDPVNRLLEVRHDDPGGDPVVACTYHDDGSAAPPDAGDHTAGGRLVSVRDEAGLTVFDYDERGRMARKRMTPAGGDPLEVLLGHRPDGLIDTVTYPAPGGGQPLVARYAYDRRGRLTSLAGVIEEIAYDDAGLATTTSYANGTVRHDAYDPLTSWLTRSRLEGPGGDLRDVSYGHDLVGNLVSVTSPDSGLSWTYTYDDLYRLVEAARGSGESYQYAYNDAGDLASSSQLGAFTYGQSGAAATCLTRAGGDRFGYDDRGLATSAPWGTNTYDAEGRLRRIERGDGTRAELTYGHNGTLVRRDQFDANGERSSRVDSPDQLVWIEDGELVLQLSDGERIVARQRADGSRSWLHHDHLGSLVLVTDEAGEVTLALTYDPYGQVLERNGTAVARDGFGAGEPVTAELVLLGARWYCPRIGRFLTPDPVVGGIDDPLAWNAYLYCRDNPVSLVDPTGRWSWRVFGMVMAAIAIIALVVIVSVFTFGIGTPGAVAIGSVTWGAIFTATMVGIAAGGVIGGIAAARAGGDAGDIVLGALVGAAVGGWAAFGAAFAGPAAAGLFGLHSGVAAGAVAGGVSGAINGAAMGFAAGFAGGRNNGFKDVMEKVLVGAIVGAAIGAALGALSGMTPPKGESARDSVGKAFKAETPSGPGGNLPPSGQPTTPGGLPGDPSLHSLGDAAGKTGLGMASKIGGAVLPHVAASTAGFTGSYLVQTIAVDLSSAAASGFWDDIKQYVRTHVVNIGPIGS